MNTTLSVIAALAALLFQRVPAAAQGLSRGADPELLKYIRGADADPACGVCLQSAKKHAEHRRGDAPTSKTRGMARVPAGDYQIGAEPGKGEPDEMPRHPVKLDSFFLDKKEVSIGEYMEFVKATGANHPEWAKPGGEFNLETGKEDHYGRLVLLIKTCPSCPVFGVRWEDAAAYCAWKKRRLPTEAEWEAAAAAGARTKYAFGDSEENAGAFAWYEANSEEAPHPGGRKAPNAYGLHDMHGNVWEWTQDLYDKGYYAVSERSNPTGPASGRGRVIRGGSWASAADETALTNRASYSSANDDIGFRCALSEKEAL